LPEQRAEVYGYFEQYQEMHEQHGWRDDMDRVVRILLPL
jgi:hypothetical protein